MLKPGVYKQDSTSGPDNAIITLVEYGDYECPHCGEAYGIVKNIREQTKNYLRFVFRNFPIQESQPNALTAGVAAEAAARQNAFWPVHDLIFENQEQLTYDDLMGHAGNLQLNLKTLC